MTTLLESMIREALAYEAEAFESDIEVNGADLVEWFAEWRQRAKTALQAEHAPAPASLHLPEDGPMRFRNHYRHCGQEWEDTWSCACNDECPVCGAEIEPYDSEDLSPDEDVDK